MLQIALLLLGCALSRYLWAINVAVASVVLGVTSFGVIFYLFIVIAGTASESCPYQTPASRAFRYLGPKVRSILRSAALAIVSTPSIIASVVVSTHSVITSATISALLVVPSAFRNTPKKSKTVRTVKMYAQWYHPWWTGSNFMPFLKRMVRELPRALVSDVCHLGRVMVQPLVAFSVGAYRFGTVVVGLLASLSHSVHSWLHGVSPTPERGLDQQITALDLRCISWTLQTSLDKAIRLPTLKHLMAMGVLPDFDPSLVANCFGVFIGCINVGNHKVVIMHGLEELATLSAMCFLRTFHYLLIMDPTSNVLEDVRRRHDRIFPLGTDFGSLQFYYAMAKIHGLINQTWDSRHVRWDNYRPSTQEYIPVAQDMAEAARVEYQKSQHRKVPRWILHFAFCSLSLDPPPPTPVVIDCLSIIAVDLGCDVSNIGSATLDERCVRVLQKTIILTSN